MELAELIGSGFNVSSVVTQVVGLRNPPESQIAARRASEK